MHKLVLNSLSYGPFARTENRKRFNFTSSPITTIPFFSLNYKPVFLPLQTFKTVCMYGFDGGFVDAAPRQMG
jgi:hypothetical protein